MGRTRRVHHASVPGPDSVLALDADEAHHVIHVLRLGPGDPLSVFDGRGREWDATLTGVDRSGVKVRIGRERSDPVDPALGVTLYQGLCRPDRMEWAIQKATEVGVRAIHPLVASRSDGPLPSPDRLERWRRVAREACKQSGRRCVPAVGEPVAAPQEVPQEVLALMLVPGREERPIGSFLCGPPPQAVWLLVGPEGGLHPGDVRALEAKGFRRAELGPRTLRTETAGVIASALVLHAWGDLGRG